jgi:hypothetical protein
MSSLTLAFPEPLADKYRPQTVEEFCGLEKPKKIMQRFIEAPYPSEWLFEGPSAFQTINEGSEQDILRARHALRQWIGTQHETTFRNLTDTGVLAVLLEEFANFAIFLGEEINQANVLACVNPKAGNA